MTTPIIFTIKPDEQHPHKVEVSCNLNSTKLAYDNTIAGAVANRFVISAANTPLVSALHFDTTPAVAAVAGQRDVLARLLREAQTVLDTLQAEDQEDGGAALLDLRARVHNALTALHTQTTDLLSSLA